MSSLALRKERATSLSQYERHKPEQTLLYQIIEQHYQAFTRLMEQQGRPLPFHVKQEFEDYLKCGRLEQWRQGEGTGLYRRSANHRSHFEPPGQERILANADESVA